MNEFDIDVGELGRLELKLKQINDVALPIAVQTATNANAFEARRVAIATIERKMITRNRWTTGQGALQVEKSPRTRQIERVRAVLGATRAYLALQEFGGLNRDRWLPTTYASNEGESAPVRRKLPIASRARRGRNVQDLRRGVTAAAAIREAKKNKVRYFRMKWKRGRMGVFQLKGTQREPVIKMIADVTNRARRLPANPWLNPTLDEVRKSSPPRYLSALEFQLLRTLKK